MSSSSRKSSWHTLSAVSRLWMHGLAFPGRSTSPSLPSRPARRPTPSGMVWSPRGRLATGFLLLAIRLPCLILFVSDFSPAPVSPASP
eukprot:10055141-Alexandrium_andersonii.AAC.1